MLCTIFLVVNQNKTYENMKSGADINNKGLM